MKILITGISGVGKTTTLAELQKMGNIVIDLDESGICKWKNKDTQDVVSYGLDGKDYSWLKLHGWYCDIDQLKDILSTFKEDKNIFVSALTENIGEVVSLFDKVFVLEAPENLLRQRLSSRTNNIFGRKEDEQDFIILEQGKLLENINGPTIIETGVEASDVAKKILESV